MNDLRLFFVGTLGALISTSSLSFACDDHAEESSVRSSSSNDDAPLTEEEWLAAAKLFPKTTKDGHVLVPTSREEIRKKALELRAESQK